MTRKIVTALLFTSCLASAAGIVDEVKEALNRADFAGADAKIQNYRKSVGVTPEMMEALSWMARAEVGRGHADDAEKYAKETYTLATALVKKKPLGKDPNSPLAIALGASIEAQAEVYAMRGQRTEAVTYLRGQAALFPTASIRPRIQKNINLLSLEGKPAPALQGVTLPKGKVALIFFWAHWCPDCKAEVGVLRQLKADFAGKGFALLAPTQKYGYVAGGEDAPADVETKYIEQIRHTYYEGLIEAPAVVNEENFRVYGASTTPTLVLVDRYGVVKMYHPGTLTYAELKKRIAALL